MHIEWSNVIYLVCGSGMLMAFLTPPNHLEFQFTRDWFVKWLQLITAISLLVRLVNPDFTLGRLV